jgi:uncharacterized membrane protein YcaP (DUF421 family)
MTRNRISEHDLLEDLRLNGNVSSERQAELAVLERNGQISVVRRDSAHPPQLDAHPWQDTDTE